jgi:hypothetical protein
MCTCGAVCSAVECVKLSAVECVCTCDAVCRVV